MWGKKCKQKYRHTHIVNINKQMTDRQKEKFKTKKNSLNVAVGLIIIFFF